MSDSLRVAVVGCGFIGGKRVESLGPDQLIGCFDSDSARARDFAANFGTTACTELDSLLKLEPDVVVVATTHDALAETTIQCLNAGCHVLVEKPAATCLEQINQMIATAEAQQRLVKVGFNHRFYPGIREAACSALSGDYGRVMFVRARYGHGGRIGYEKEWRAVRAVSGGGELVDQGLHLLDLSYWLLGELPIHSSLLKTSYWPMDVEDNAVIVLGEPGRTGPWAMLHATWTEWKNMFSLEIYCERAKLQVDGLSGSYGQQTLRLYKMKPELGPPDLLETSYPAEDVSWRDEWTHFRNAILSCSSDLLWSSLEEAKPLWKAVESAYRTSGYA